MSTLQVEDLRAKFNQVVSELVPTIKVLHMSTPPGRMLQCDLPRYGIAGRDASAIRETLRTRNDVSRAEIGPEGRLSVYYKTGGLSGDKVANFVAKLEEAIKQQVARKMAYHDFPRLQRHTGTD